MRWLLFIPWCLLLVMPPPAGFAAEPEADRQHLSELYREFRSGLQRATPEVSLQLATEIYELSRRIYGEKSKIHAVAAFNLAQLADQESNHLEAARLYQEHIDILDRLETPRDEQYLFKLDLLAQSYRQAGKKQKAVVWGKKVLALARDLKMSSDKVADCEMGLGWTYYVTPGKVGVAAHYFDKAYAHFIEAYGEDHIKAAEALFWGAKVDLYYHDGEKAAKKLERVRIIFENKLPNGHELIWQLFKLLVRAYMEMGDAEKATERSITAAVHSPKDPDGDYYPLVAVTPHYPYVAQMDRKTGFIIAEFTVTETGEVEDIKTIGGKNIETFEKAAHKALAKFRYAPTIRDGKPVKAMGVQHKVTFDIGY